MSTKTSQLQALLMSLGVHGALALMMLLFVVGNPRPGNHGGAPGRGMTTFVTVAKSGKKTLNRKTTVQAANAGVSTEAVTEIALKAGVATARSPSPARSEAAAQSGSPGTGDGRDGVQMIADGKPEYPPFSRQLGEEGDVVLRFKIGASGAILDTLLDNSSGFPRLDQSALDFSKTVRFIVTHAMAGPIEKRVTFVFRLE